MNFNIRLLFFLCFLPLLVYSQLIDNRDLPPEALRIKPPFEDTSREKINTADEKTYIILDNADDITIKNFADSEIVEVVMLGNVRVRFDGNFLKSEKLIVSIKDSIIINVGAYGNIEFTFNKTKYLAESINYQPDMERGVMYQVRSVLNAQVLGATDKPWFFDAEKVTIQDADRFVLDQVVLTTSDVRFPHYQLKVSKLWYIQNKIALAMGMQYMAGQASFFWLPAYLQIEGAGGLRTSFGNERRIGYYFINNYDLKTKIGDFKFGFDFYERQGQYFSGNYQSVSKGILQELELQVDLANDQRIVRDGDFYSQWVVPSTINSEQQRISQFAWRYKINTKLGIDGIGLQLQLEDLNDPFFLSKYSYRSRFDDARSIDFQSLVSPQANSWYNYQGDIQPQVDSVNQKIVFTMDNFTAEASFDYVRTIRENAQNRSNQFLNNYYDYELRSVVLPSLSYNFGTLDLFQYTNSTKSKVTVIDSRGRKTEFNNLKKYEEFASKLSNQSNMVVTKQVFYEDNKEVIREITNWQPITITNVTTNDYEWLRVKADATASVRFKAEQTFGSNTSSATTDLEFLTNTNRVLISDLYQHNEDGSLGLTLDAFDNIFSVRNQISFGYQDQWSSFASEKTNTLRSSGMDINYTLGTTVNPNKIWRDDELMRTKVDFKSSLDYSHPLYRLKRIEEGLSPRESSVRWDNTFNLEFLQWRRQTILGMTLGVQYNRKMRIPNDSEQNKINNDPNDFFIRNIVFEEVETSAKASVWWFNLGTSIRMNVLQTETNRSLTKNFTNRLVGGFPQLVFEFTPHSDYNYIPKLTYRYNLFERSTNLADPFTGEIRTARRDKSFNLDVVWDLRLKNYHIPALYPFIYEISEFGLVFRYYQDFVSMRNSFLRIDFSIGVKFTKYLTFKFSSQMLNNKIYLYYPGGIFNGQRFALPGEQPKNFFQDLGDGLKFWDIGALRRSSFKLQSLNFELIHDLDTWDMRLIFNLGRVTDEIKQVAYWEPFVGVAFTMKGSNAVNFFPEFNRRFVPSEFQ
ncbi:MAG: hypothetical protein ACRCVW_06490 [Brevinema sp.]